MICGRQRLYRGEAATLANLNWELGTEVFDQAQNRSRSVVIVPIRVKDKGVANRPPERLDAAVRGALEGEPDPGRRPGPPARLHPFNWSNPFNW